MIRHLSGLESELEVVGNDVGRWWQAIVSQQNILRQ